MTTEKAKLCQEAAYRAWLDLTSEFSEWQRIQIAKQMSHGFNICEITVKNREGESSTFVAKKAGS